MHFHRDMLAVCDGYARNILRAEQKDRFVGSAPLAFTFGFGGVLFPMHIGASFVVLEKTTPDDILNAIEHYKTTVCFTAPTAYRAMIGKLRAATSPRCANVSPPARPFPSRPSMPGSRPPASS